MNCLEGVGDRLDRFVLADLDAGIPVEAGTGFDYVVAADVIEHLRHPDALLHQIADVLSPTGQAFISTPNFAHWYPRVRTAIGAFDYDRRGILDETHLRFFTRRTFLRLLRQCRFVVDELAYTGLPLDAMSTAPGRRVAAVRRVDRGLVLARPTLFAYQFVARVHPRASGTTIAGGTPAVTGPN